MMKALQSSSFLGGGNAAYLEEQYEAYLQDPSSVEDHWRDYFDKLPVTSMSPEAFHTQIREQFKGMAKQPKVQTVSGNNDFEHEHKQIRVLQLINAYRMRGHQWATTNPIADENTPKTRVLELELSENGLSEADMDTVFQTGPLYGPETATLREILTILERSYTSSIGAEYMHILDTQQKLWLQKRLEEHAGVPTLKYDEQINLLKGLTAAEGLERYLHSRYVGQKRFSLEGGESLIPMLNSMIERSSEQGVSQCVIGMAHRGRLNVLVNVMGKKPNDLFSEFEGKMNEELSAGDVKYHQGFSTDLNINGKYMHLALAFNPSHLEIVGPVVEGSVRSRQDRYQKTGKGKVLPIVIHGDAAFAGQGCVAETFNMAYVRGYSTHGTVHIVVNNQIGFTTSNLQDARSTQYCTDVAKMINAPIFHVNGDDPEAVYFATQIATDFRNTFGKDVVLDIVCYRRHGHNEADEPSATQPMMYKKVKALSTTRQIYADKLVNSDVIDQDFPNNMVREFRDHMDAGDSVVKNLDPNSDNSEKFTVDWSPYLNGQWRDAYETTVDKQQLIALARQLTDELPDDLVLHPRVKKLVDDRRKMNDEEILVDWGYAENLAYATLLNSGHAVRISGQDCGRGTFFHRHAVLHNQTDGSSYTPLENVAEDQPEFRVIDSVLSEEAVLAFEYGYATTDPNTLVIWEGQFGDFANGAQVVIDQFITSGEAKWGRLCGLTMLLPHGYEGQGPEHSSARLERYMQLCAEDNIQVCVPSTPAQCYHMLRRQALRDMRRPLIVMTPKSLLRHKLAVNSIDELANGKFEPVLDEIDNLDSKKVDRLVFCSGKVYYDLLEKRREEKLDNIAIVRVEQLYPFPYDEMHAVIKKYPNANTVIWAQEEPRNQGAWYSTKHRFERVISSAQQLGFAGRPPSASPAVGYAREHLKEQKLLVEQALDLAENSQAPRS